MNSARVTVAQIETPYRDRRDYGLGFALVPGLPVERFGRVWRLEVAQEVTAQIRASQELPDLIRGRLGFDKVTGQAPAWSEQLEQFVTLPQHDGDVVPFVIRSSDLCVAFQRTAKIKRQSFIGAMQKILREGSQNDDWLVKDRTTTRTLEGFRDAARRVTEVTILVGPTNPGWKGQELFQPYIDDLGGDTAKIVVKGDDLDLDSEPIAQARVHAIEREYGELGLKGMTAEGVSIEFDSEDPVPVLDAVVDRGTDGGVPYSQLEAAFSELDELQS